MSMQPQPGIFAFGTIEHCYVELDLAPNRDPRELASGLAALHGPDTPLVATNAVVGLRPELWASIAPDAAPPGVRSFAPIEAGDFSMPATQHDAWIWIAGASRDIVFDSALAAIRSLDGVASVATEVTGFGYQRNRDLTGFIDGTENPSAVEAPAVAVEQEGLRAGAAVLLVQQWEHLTSFATLSTKEQEGVIGRTKDKSIELEEDEMPIDSHVSRNVASAGLNTPSRSCWNEWPAYPTARATPSPVSPSRSPAPTTSSRRSTLWLACFRPRP
jgi:putative iron-dependent peroxidase